jgi:serine/threonine protein phosphatase 1
MSSKMKYFVVSDIHAHYSALKIALDKQGYDEDNLKHHLLVLGDLFDRGDETLKVLDYLYRLNQSNKATILLGNHDTFILDFLRGKLDRVTFNVHVNGFRKTLEQLSGQEIDLDKLEEIVVIINEKFPYLEGWLSSFPLFLELDDYIFVHAGIDGSKPDWRTTTSRRDFVWNREFNLPRVPFKTVVAGHHRVATIRKKTEDYDSLFLEHPELFDILYEDGKILIDRFVEVSNEINVLILDIKA